MSALTGNEIEFARVYREAAGLIRRRGLAKGTQLAGNGSVCVAGAISIALTGEPYSDKVALGAPIIKVLVNHIGLRPGNRIDSWNNQKERTGVEVIATLEGAADAIMSKLPT